MAGKSPVRVRDDEKAALKALASGADRAEADRARAILLTLAGWTSGRIAEAFSVRQDTVRIWRSDFISGGVEALKARVAPGPEPLKARAALGWPSRRSAPVAIGPIGPWPASPRRSPARRGDDLKIAAVEGFAPKRGFAWPPAPHLKGRRGRDAVDRIGLRLDCARRKPRPATSASVRRRERSSHPSLSRPRLGQARRGFARAGARTG